MPRQCAQPHKYKHTTIIFACLIITLVCSGRCPHSSSNTRQAQRISSTLPEHPPFILCADRIFYQPNGKSSSPSCLLILDSTIADTGTLTALQKKAPSVPYFQLDSVWITPALTDGHAHLLTYAFEPAHTVPPFTSQDSFLAWLTRQIPNRGEVLYVRGWDESRWGGTPLTRTRLDQAVLTHPVLAVRIDGHLAVSNSEFLRRFPPPPSLRPLVDQDQGIWKEEALTWVLAHLPPAPFSQALARLLALQDTLRKLGIGAVVEMGLPARLLPYLAMLDTVAAWQTFVDVYVEASSEALHPLCTSSSDAFPRYGRTYAIHGFKLYADGSLGARTACLRQPYRNTTQHGVCRLTQKELRYWAQIARNCGLSLAIHVIGDRPLDTLYAAFPGGAPPVPHARIEHLQVVPNDALTLFQKGWIPSVQPCHWLTDQRWLDERLPPDYPALLYPYHLLMHFSWCIGTDFPVEPLTPARNFQGVIERATPNMSFLYVWKRVLAGYTVSNRQHCIPEHAYMAKQSLLPPPVFKPGTPATFIAITVPTRTNPWRVLAFWLRGTRVYPP